MYMEQAEELAMIIHNKEFCDLTKDQQERVWLQAEQSVVDNMADHADNLRKSSKEGE